MVWVSNLSNAAITVTITNKTGGSASNYTVQPFISAGPTGIQIKNESWGNNHWSRSGAETLKFTINGTEKSFQVNPDDHVTFYVDTYEVSSSKTTRF